MNFTQTLLIALIPSVLTGIISYLVFYQQLMSFKRKTMAERAAKHFLKHKCKLPHNSAGAFRVSKKMYC